MTLEDIKPSISQLSRDAVMDIHQTVRASRLVTKSTVTRPRRAKAGGVSRKPQLSGLLKHLTPADAEFMLTKLEEVENARRQV